jgi:hypothetical protein
MRRCIAGLVFSDVSKTHNAFIFKGQGVQQEWKRRSVAGLLSSDVSKERIAWIFLYSSTFEDEGN